MAQTPGKVHAGPARIFVGVTPGTTGTPPTYITHTNGVPGSGSEVGLTQGDAVFVYKATKEGIGAEQSLADVDVFTKDEEGSLVFTCQEMTYATLQRAFDTVGSESVGGGDAFYFGGGTSILAPRTECVMLTSMQRNAPTKFLITVLYKVYSMDGVKLPVRKTDKTTYQVTLNALADLTRNAGDQMGYMRWEK